MMDYWISSNNVQMGPYSLQQLQLMWRQGQLTTTAYYYDGVRAEWVLLRALVESTRGLFTVPEAFVRLGQNRLSGCLSVYNQEEAIHLFVDGGFITCAMSEKEKGEFALSRALHLENAAYDWFLGAPPPTTDLRLNISEYALKNSIGRDVPVTTAVKRKQNTVAFPKSLLDKVEAERKFNYILVSDEDTSLNLRLPKMNNVIGRGEGCDLVIDNPQVSRKHCLLEVWEDNVKVKDLDSSNGTTVNGIGLREGFLRIGDELGLGRFKLFLQKEQKKAPAIG